MQCHIHYNLILKNVREYSQIEHALAPLSLICTSSNIISTLMVFHLDLDGFLFLFEKLQTRPRFLISSKSFNLTFKLCFTCLQMAILEWCLNISKIVLIQKIL